MSQDEIVQATLVRPGPVVTYSAEPPVKSRYGAMAVASVILPFLTGAAGVFLVIVGWNMPKFWFSWVMLGVMLLLGFVISVLPLRANAGQRKSIVRQCALTGLFLNIMAILFSLGCVAMAGGIMYLQQPEVQAAIAKAQAEEKRKRQAEVRVIQQAQREERAGERRQQQEALIEARRAQRLIEQQREQEAREQAQREEEARAAEEREALLRDRPAAIDRYYAEVVRRFQEGSKYGRLPSVITVEGQTAPSPESMRDQPLQLTEHTVRVKQVDRDLLTGEPMTVDDITVQPIAMIEKVGSVHPFHRMIWQPMMWESPQDATLLYVMEDTLLWEVDTENWRLKREVDLRGTGLSIARCESGIVVALRDPDCILVLDPATLEPSMTIPVHGIRHLAASPVNDRVFVIMESTSRFPITLAAINLETRRLEYVPRPCDALGPDNEIIQRIAYPNFDQLILTADGKYLVGVGPSSHRWSVAENGELTCLERSNLHYIRVHLSTSPDNRLVGFDDSLYDITRGIDEPVTNCEEFAQWRMGITNDGRLFSCRWGYWNLVACDSTGKGIARYNWLDQDDRDHYTMSIHILPDPQQLLVDTRLGWYVVWLPETSPSEP